MSTEDPEDRKNSTEDEKAFPQEGPETEDELVEEWEEESFPGSDPPANY